MRRITLMIVLSTLLLPISIWAQQLGTGGGQPKESLALSKPGVGFVKDGKYLLSVHFGIEQWEDGKKSTFRTQQWDLSCNSPSEFTEGGKTSCSLTRTVFDNWPGLGTAIVQSHNHYVEDGTLRIRNADWRNGRLDLAVILPNLGKSEEPIEVAIRLAYERDSIYLDSFKAFGIHREVFGDSVVALEYRIPEYDYTMQLPVKIRGMKSEETRKRDELFRSLSAKDAELWRQVGPALFDRLSSQDEQTVMSKVVPGWDGKRDLTEDENKRVARWVGETLINTAKQKLPGSGISPEGQKRILDFLSASLVEK